MLFRNSRNFPGFLRDMYPIIYISGASFLPDRTGAYTSSSLFRPAMLLNREYLGDT